MIKRLKLPLRIQQMVEWKCFLADGADPVQVMDHMHNAQVTFFLTIPNISHRGSADIRAERAEHDGMPGLMYRLGFLGNRSDAARLKRRYAGFGYTDPSGKQPEFRSLPLVILPPEEAFEDEPEDELPVDTLPEEEADSTPMPPAPEQPTPAMPTNVLALRSMAKEMGVDVADISGAGSREKIRTRLLEAMNSGGRSESGDS